MTSFKDIYNKGKGSRTNRIDTACRSIIANPFRRFLAILVNTTPIIIPFISIKILDQFNILFFIPIILLFLPLITGFSFGSLIIHNRYINGKTGLLLNRSQYYKFYWDSILIGLKYNGHFEFFKSLSNDKFISIACDELKIYPIAKEQYKKMYSTITNQDAN